MLNKNEIAKTFLNTIKEKALKSFNETNFIKYLDACDEIDRSDLQDKDRLKDTHFLLFLVKMKILRNDTHDCFITIDKENIFLENKKIKNNIDYDLLEDLCKESGIYTFYKTEGDLSSIYFSASRKRKRY